MSKKMSAGRGKAGRLSLGAAVALVASAGMAVAADAPRTKRKMMPPPPVVEAPVETKLVDFAFGLRAASDYNFRGISQSDRGFSPQGYGELQLFDNFVYAGVAGYGVDLPTKPLAEIDLTAGIRPKLGPLTFDFGVIGYVYPDETQFIVDDVILTPRDTDFLEVAGKVSYTYMDSLTLGAGVFHTGDFLGSGANATYFNATAKYVIPDTHPAGRLRHLWRDRPLRARPRRCLSRRLRADRLHLLERRRVLHLEQLHARPALPRHRPEQGRVLHQHHRSERRLHRLRALQVVQRGVRRDPLGRPRRQPARHLRAGALTLLGFRIWAGRHLLPPRLFQCRFS